MNFKRIATLSVFILFALFLCISCTQAFGSSSDKVSISISSWSCDTNNTLSVICKVKNNTSSAMDYINIGIAGLDADKSSFIVAYGTVLNASPGVEYTVTATSDNTPNLIIKSVAKYSCTYGSSY